MSNLTTLTLKPGKTESFTASGAIAAGKPVILNDAGTVTQVGETTHSEAVGSPTVATVAAASNPNIVYDSVNDRVVAIWWRSSDKYGLARVGTVSGTSITWGTLTIWRTIALDETPQIAFNANTGQFVIAFTEVTGNQGTNHGWCVVGEVTGTNKNELTFGTPVKSYAGWAPKHRIAYDPDTYKMLLLQKQAGTGAYACAVTLSGTGTGATVSYGTFAQYTSSSNSDAHVGVYYDTSQNCFVIAWNENTGYARTATISGTSVSYGTASTFYSGSAFGGIPATFDSEANKGIIAWVDGNTGNKIGKLRVVTVANNALSFGNVTTIYSTTSGNDIDTGENNLILIYAGSGVTNQEVIVGFMRDGNDNYKRGKTTINGTAMETPVSIGNLYSDDVNSNNTKVCVNTTGKLIYVTKPSQTAGNMIDNYVYGIAEQLGAVTTNITASKLIGIADAAISNGAAGEVSLKGGLATKGLSSLTPGSDYYAQGNGTISTTSTAPAVKLGKALSATAINLEYAS